MTGLVSKENQKTPSDNRIRYVQIWYRLFKYTHGERCGEHYIGLGLGYFIDLTPSRISWFVANFEKLENRTPEIEQKLAQARFHLRWLDSVIRLPILTWLPYLRRYYLRFLRRLVELGGLMV